ncbi:hypothetical protein AC249_AIPGENE891 [Exaiptasia diaphana]|nr:hypothetical protein AC249_AIPGENE891 [Exaiptasia diaphana]
MKLLIIFALAAVTLASKGLHKKTNDPLEGEAVSTVHIRIATIALFAIKALLSLKKCIGRLYTKPQGIFDFDEEQQ